VATIAIGRESQPRPAIRTPAIFSARARRVDAALTGARTVVTDGLLLVGMVFAIPFVVLAFGIPVALALQLLLWIGRLL
jgi:hypothetical protein